MTVRDALAEAVKILDAVDSPRLDAQLLLTWTLKCRREDLAREPDRPLSERDALVFQKAVSLRSLRRPLPYITGEAWFYGRPFKLNRAVLIPRPETEELAAWALEKMDEKTGGNATAADIGTGSGCLAVTLACERSSAKIWATDISADALNVARKNVVRHGVGARVTLTQGDLLAPLTGQKLDVIVSNPPYVTERERPTLQPEVRDYEPTLALTGMPNATGADGTLLHRRLLAEALELLTPGGWLLLEVGAGQAETVAETARSMGYEDVTVRSDLAGIGRVVGGRR